MRKNCRSVAQPKNASPGTGEDALLLGQLVDAGRGDAPLELAPEVEGALGDAEGEVHVGAVLAERGDGGIPLGVVDAVHHLDVGVELPLGKEQIHHPRDPVGDAEVLADGEGRVYRLRLTHEPAEPQSRRDGLAEAVGLHDEVAAAEAQQGGQALTLETEVAVDVVFDNHEAALVGKPDELLPAFKRHAGAGGELEGGDGVHRLHPDAGRSQLVDLALDGVDVHAVAVDGHGVDLGPEGLHVADGVGERRRLDDHRITGVKEAVDGQGDGLHRSRGEQYAVGPDIYAIAPRDSLGDAPAKRPVAVDHLGVTAGGVAVLQGAAAVAGNDLAAEALEVFEREGLLGGEAHVEVVEDGGGGEREEDRRAEAGDVGVEGCEVGAHEVSSPAPTMATASTSIMKSGWSRAATTTLVLAGGSLGKRRCLMSR